MTAQDTDLGRPPAPDAQSCSALWRVQALEAAIERGLPRVEAGAQGEHKLQRGYMPSMTHSSHYIRDPRLRAAIDSYLSHERIQIEYTMEAMAQHVSPYKEKA